MTESAIGLFAGLSREAGGIEVIAIDGWRAVAAGRTGRLVVYDPTGRPTPPDLRPEVAARTKAGLAARVLARSWPADTLLCWHLGLLKLVPLLRGFRGRLCLNLHGIEAWRRPGRLTRRLLDRVDQFTSISQHTWDRFAAVNPHLAGRPHTIVPIGLGEPAAGPTPPVGPTPAALIVARMSRAEDYKGHRELIACWPKVRDRVPGAELWVAGDGDLRPELERLARDHGLADAVRFFGRVPEAAKADLLAGCRALVMPSRAEGFGLVYLEAMRVGRPCLVSDQDAGREVVNPPEAGLAVNPADDRALVDAVARLLTPSAEWDGWSAAARTRYEAEFTARHFQQRLTTALFGRGSA